MSIDGALLVVGAATLVLGLLSDGLKRVWLSLPLVAVGVGALLGPEVLGVFDPARVSHHREVLEELARLTLAFSLTSTALQFTPSDVRAIRRPATVLLTAVMASMWCATALGAWLLLDVPFWIAVMIGAILTPTDPVVASTIVTGPMAEKNLPRTLRRTLQLESGANDGLAIMFVLLPVLVLSEPTGEAGAWLAKVSRELAVAVSMGVGIGGLAGALFRFSIKRKTLEKQSFHAASLGLALLALGATHALGGSGVLASFLAGISFSFIIGEQAAGIEHSQSGVERVFVVALFLLVGALLPWSDWAALGWPGVFFALWAITLRRPPAAAAALTALAPGVEGKDVAFLSWFGPLGAAALYYALFVEQYHPSYYGEIFGAATLAIVVSVLVHSMSATPVVRRHAGRSPLTTLAHPLQPDSNEAP